MSTLGWATWAAIVVLVVGSSAIFLWFAVELWRGWRAHRSRRSEVGDGTPVDPTGPSADG